MSLIKEIIVLYEDPDCVVINKPAGIIVHPDGKREEESVVPDDQRRRRLSRADQRDDAIHLPMEDPAQHVTQLSSEGNQLCTAIRRRET